ncbi:MULTISPECIES: NTP transferase domain-containing protein [unclassified Clostridium]|uniref:Choline/ethanolamine kinase family protein n=1 Tax=Clostridium botulinum (strain Eklund 17B / Type B) TaxID=935198 RepID=B2TQC8_CLOBB|nr:MULTISPECIES: NTP transferase domain-containing protein [unclassified Clostridium]ACD22420.1 choline/ethanolamine kinase family protein [Clostridium botulinum B str. Eklund 17B (NRP)]MBN1039776.1 winged helix-turn-helix transcriptional regulator [Clostridium botulinum]MBN1053322.1 winged helix-turn-helix transcriptional regulator [Clostridium botulinum]MBN1056519.1 winged helix-turn-helix transcriptional regulator [Clostridium botulinum]MBY6975565.1 phosphotransferase [Clostridium botulinum
MLEDRLEILKILNNNFNINQRELSKRTNISLGKVNSILKDFTIDGTIERVINNRGILYRVTEKGMKILEENLASAKNTRLKIHEEDNKSVKEAVILAAGRARDFGRPVGMLEIEDFKLIDRTLNILKENGINKITIITGYESVCYEEYFKNNKNINLVKSDKYKWTGTMYSLSLAREYVKDDFLLIENDLIFEKRAIKELIESNSRDCILLTNESGSGDEAFVEIRNNHLFKMSKDIHQFNRIDGEMIGITKVSHKLYQMMLEEFKDNINPYLNYEYVLLDVARDYNIGFVKIDDLAWGDADTKKEYENILNHLYPTIRRRELNYEINTVKTIVREAMKVSEDEISEVVAAGGMTNKNYRICVKGKRYILRVAGIGTECMISRKNEMFNSSIASEREYNVETPYFNVETGIKISTFIENAETLTPRSVKKEENLKQVTRILRDLHEDNEFPMKNEFNVFRELEKYEDILKTSDGEFFHDYDEVRERFMKLEQVLKECDRVFVPSHNDLVSENLVKDTEGRIYLIDWEYSGINDDMWDLAALSLENNFSEDDTELMFRLYFNGEADDNSRKRLLIHQISQDLLWAVWTLIKENEGDDFGTYGIDRYNRGKENLNKLEAEF